MVLGMCNFISHGKRMANTVNDGVCWITYENAILNKKNLEIKISNFLNLNKSEISNLGHIFNHPKKYPYSL